MKFSITKNNLPDRIKKMNASQDRAVKMALGRVGLAILQDSVQENPKPPFETGFLRGAIFMYVEGENVPAKGQKKQGKVYNSKGKVVGTLLNDPPSSIPNDRGFYTVNVGFNTPYAKAQHENLGTDWFPTVISKRGTPKDQSDVSGKFLESKLARFKNRYAEIFAKTFGQYWGKE